MDEKRQRFSPEKKESKIHFISRWQNVNFSLNQNGSSRFIIKSRFPTAIAVKVLDAITNAAEMRNYFIQHSKHFTPQFAADVIARNILAL